MKVLLLGVGLQGKVALSDLVKSENITEIIAADYDINALNQLVKEKGYSKVTCEYLDANDQKNIDKLMSVKPDIVIDLLPYPFVDTIVKTAIKFGLNMINSMSLSSEVMKLAEEAKKKNITILPDFGLDPGIDLVMLGQGMRELDEIEVINSYGAGIPPLEYANNPLKYKVTWSFSGLLRTYYRDCKIIKDGKIIEIKAIDLFSPENIHDISIDNVGKLEAFINGNSLSYLESAGIKQDSDVYRNIKDMGRYTMRWPGHSEFWKKLVDLHFLDPEPITIDGKEVSRNEILAKIIEPHLQLQDNEKDLAILFVELIGKKDGKKKRITYQLVDERDLTTGFTAMSRTVGHTISLGAELICSGKITKKGILSPVHDIPFEILKEGLEKKGILMTSKTEFI